MGTLHVEEKHEDKESAGIWGALRNTLGSKQNKKSAQPKKQYENTVNPQITNYSTTPGTDNPDSALGSPFNTRGKSNKNTSRKNKQPETDKQTALKDPPKFKAGELVIYAKNKNEKYAVIVKVDHNTFPNYDYVINIDGIEKQTLQSFLRSPTDAELAERNRNKNKNATKSATTSAESTANNKNTKASTAIASGLDWNNLNNLFDKVKNVTSKTLNNYISSNEEESDIPSGTRTPPLTSDESGNDEEYNAVIKKKAREYSRNLSKVTSSNEEESDIPSGTRNHGEDGEKKNEDCSINCKGMTDPESIAKCIQKLVNDIEENSQLIKKNKVEQINDGGSLTKRNVKLTQEIGLCKTAYKRVTRKRYDEEEFPPQKGGKSRRKKKSAKKGSKSRKKKHTKKHRKNSRRKTKSMKRVKKLKK